ncbi:hypothetical protein POM88_048675 [Heracleum sosnowskyi]|uniref:Malectin-like domain-containing protein n=1 Tax=Heracleum sosnowskyi TaxID=360622 RepID=A0AAD8GVR5_9APIA|nr:hypothetical protein POM88_048675 [Heracleum sosnowskyi]
MCLRELIRSKPAMNQLPLHEVILSFTKKMHFDFINANLDITGWKSIDCGSNDTRWEGMLQWDVDLNYTQTGSNKLVQNGTDREELNTLRFFPNNTQDNCYIVPAETQIIRYIIRAGFYYGNYDGLSSPPAFNLFINDVKWTTINTSKNNGEPFYEEIMYENNGSGFLKICLVQIKDGGVPFINSIEAVVLWDKLYSQMENNVTYNLVTRTNLGGVEIRFDPSKFDEMYNRIWSNGVSQSNCTRLVGLTDVTATVENYPPYLVLMDSVEPIGTNTITLTVDLPQSTPQSAYFVFYITELVEKNINDRRTMKLEIDGQDQGTVEAPSNGETAVITKYPVIVSGPTIHITLTSTEESTLPPMIAGMEVFTKWDTAVNHTPPSSAAAGFFSANLRAMEKVGWIYLAFLALQLLKSFSLNPIWDSAGWKTIDCGANYTRWEGPLRWENDFDLSQTAGSNKLVQNRTAREELNTLRIFPNNTEDSCYFVRVNFLNTPYIIRAGFYYGNYDGLSSPPIFNLFINDAKWTTINTSKNDGGPFYEEIIHENNRLGDFKICLVQIKDGGVPFINSIEVMGLRGGYSQMENNAAYNLVTRTNLGGGEIRFDPSKYDELDNRIWSQGVTPAYCAKLIGVTNVTAIIENYPPYPVLMDSVVPSGTDTITLTVDLPQSTPQSAYFVFYITELVEKKSNERRTMKLEIDGQDQGTIEAPSNGETTVITKYPVIVSGPTTNIILTRGKDSSLPPMIAAMEVFTKSDTIGNNTAPSSAAAGIYFSFAYSLMIPFVFLLAA